MASTNNHGTPDPQVTPRSSGPRRYSAEYKARILAEYEPLGKQAKGAGLYSEGHLQTHVQVKPDARRG